jgi:tetratricopeptide (TPR) repeat protein
VHRAEILQLHGAWPDALEEVERACERLGGTLDQPTAAAAWYRRGELHRLSGEFASAEDAFRQASRLGREPQPGLALMRLGQGQTDTAGAAISRALAERPDRAGRGGLLGAYAEIVLADGDVAAARAAAGELAALAMDLDSPLLRATAAQADGAVRLAEGPAPDGHHLRSGPRGSGWWSSRGPLPGEREPSGRRCFCLRSAAN